MEQYVVTARCRLFAQERRENSHYHRLRNRMETRSQEEMRKKNMKERMRMRMRMRMKEKKTRITSVVEG